MKIILTTASMMTNIHIFVYFSDAVEAYYDIWLLGEEFLKEVMISLKLIQYSIQQKKQKNRMYMDDNFNLLNYQPKWGTRG